MSKHSLSSVFKKAAESGVNVTPDQFADEIKEVVDDFIGEWLGNRDQEHRKYPSMMTFNRWSKHFISYLTEVYLTS